MSNKLGEDIHGHKDDKRIAGYIIAGTGLLYVLAVGIMSLFKPVGDPATALTIGKTLLIVGGSLLGLSVGEYFPKKYWRPG